MVRYAASASQDYEDGARRSCEVRYTGTPQLQSSLRENPHFTLNASKFGLLFVKKKPPGSTNETSPYKSSIAGPTCAKFAQINELQAQENSNKVFCSVGT